MQSTSLIPAVDTEAELRIAEYQVTSSIWFNNVSPQLVHWCETIKIGDKVNAKYFVWKFWMNLLVLIIQRIQLCVITIYIDYGTFI